MGASHPHSARSPPLGPPSAAVYVPAHPTSTVPSGFTNSVYTNAGKYHFASHFHEMVKLVQDIAGGLVITLPTEKDYNNPDTRQYIEKYLAGRAGVPTEQKLRIFSLIKDLTATDFGGYNSVVTLHGEGSLAAQIIAITRDYDLNRCKRLAEEAAGISAPASFPSPLAEVYLSRRQTRVQW